MIDVLFVYPWTYVCVLCVYCIDFLKDQTASDRLCRDDDDVRLSRDVRFLRDGDSVEYRDAITDAIAHARSSMAMDDGNVRLGRRVRDRVVCPRRFRVARCR